MPTDEDLNPKNYIAAATRVLKRLVEKLEQRVYDPHMLDAEIIAFTSSSDKVKKWAKNLMQRPEQFLNSQDKKFLTDRIYWAWRDVSDKEYAELPLSERKEIFIAYKNNK